MTFHDVLLPITISYGSEVNALTSNNVVVSGSGKRFINSLWDKFLWSYDLVYEAQSKTEFKSIIDFKILRGGQQHSFKVYDYSFNSMAQDVQGNWSTGTLAEFQIDDSSFQIYFHLTDTAATYSHKITKINTMTTFLVEVYTGGNWVAKAVTTDYTLDASTGIVTWVAGHEPNNAESVRVTCGFYRHCRFISDIIPCQFVSYDQYDISPLGIIEVKE
jgi:uncharacterized protein (TIGR02217 family)